MVLDRGLSNQAKAYAQKIANMGQLMHSSQAERDDARENLARSHLQRAGEYGRIPINGILHG